MKPKRNYQPGTPDECWTPGYALESLMPHIPFDFRHVWECASGAGLLVDTLRARGYQVHPSSIEYGQDFFDYEPSSAWEAIITNPPFSLKIPWFARCLELGKPFALLLPTETVSLGGIHKLIQHLKPQLGIIWHSPRINFYMPNKGWTGGGAQFATAWFTWGFGFTGNVYSPMPHWTRAYQKQFEIMPGEVARVGKSNGRMRQTEMSL